METEYKEKSNDLIQSYECLNACLTNYLNLCGKKISPSTVFWGGNGFVFKCREYEGSQQLLSNMYKANFLYMDKAGIEYVHDFFTTPSEELQFVVKEVTLEKNIIALKIRSDFLKYNRVYLQTIAMHYIDIVGYNKESQEFYIVDGDVPTAIPSVFSGWVDARELIEGWKKTNCEYVMFVDCEKIYAFSEREMILLVRQQLLEYCNSESNDKGVLSVSTYFKNLEIVDELQLSQIAREANYQIKVEGIWASRHYLLDFINSIGIEEGYKEKLKEIIKQWNALSMSLIKLSISKRERDKEKALSMLSNILLKEKEYFYNLSIYLMNKCMQTK